MQITFSDVDSQYVKVEFSDNELPYPDATVLMNAGFTKSAVNGMH